MCTLYGNIDYLLYEKIVGQPKLIQICMCEEIFEFWVLWRDYLLWASWIYFESYGKLWLKA